jgi:glutaminase
MATGGDGRRVGSGAVDRARVMSALSALHERYRGVEDGRLADYIPELAKSDPACFAISIVTVEGEVFEVGDRDRAFTIQSLSKPFTHALALADRGREWVMQRVGVEPSGDSFDSIIRLDANNRPHNPMVNAGAIAVTSMIAGDSPDRRLERMLAMFERTMGRPQTIDEAVFASECETGHRNRAMAYLMLNFGVLGCDVDEALELYFKQCSVLVTARDMATMAATLANGGVHPLTGERAVERAYIRDVLTVMHTCGMYNYAGEWAYTVGLPAKSGVSGGIIAVVPGQFGICVYSPPVDERGNSVRGIRVFEDLSRNCGMHVFETWHQPGSVLELIDGVAEPSPALPDTSVPVGDATVHRRELDLDERVGESG